MRQRISIFANSIQHDIKTKSYKKLLISCKISAIYGCGLQKNILKQHEFCYKVTSVEKDILSYEKK